VSNYPYSPGTRFNLNYFSWTCFDCIGANNCTNNGQCIAQNYCNCTTGYAKPNCVSCLSSYYGNTCQFLCQCDGRPCSNGFTGNGTCTCDLNEDPNNMCQCFPEYFGPTCQPCNVSCNGHGNCNNTHAGNGLCVCNPGYTLSNCTEQIEISKSQIRSHSKGSGQASLFSNPIVIGAAAGAFAIVLLSICAFGCYFRKFRKAKNSLESIMEDTKVAEFFDSSMGPGKQLSRDGSQLAMMQQHLSQVSRTSSYNEDGSTSEPPSNNVHRTWSPEENNEFNAAIPPRPQFSSFTGNLGNAGSNKPVVLRKFNQPGGLNVFPQFNDSGNNPPPPKSSKFPSLSGGIELNALPQFNDSGNNPPPPRSSKFHSQSSPHISKQGSQSSLGDDPGQEL